MIPTPGNFRRWKRAHGELNWLALIMSAGFSFLTGYATFFH